MTVKLEDFIYALHATVAENGGKVPLSQLADRFKELHNVDFRVERFLYVAQGRVDLALKRIPHVVLVKEEGGQVVVCNSQKLDISKEELLRIDQKIREKAASMRAHKRASPETKTDDVGAEKRTKVVAADAPKAVPPPAPQQQQAKGKAKAPPKPPAFAAHASKPAPPPPPHKTGVAKTTEAESPGKNDPVVVHAILRLLEQHGPMSLSKLNECFQTRWKCPFRPLALGIEDNNDIDKYFRESKHFKLIQGPQGPILCLKELPVVKEIPSVLEQISGVRQQVAVLGVKLEELQASLERAKIKADE
eukprot:GEMP01018009.1.p1 GENE.GEMP01018009.1~~GEMP01018009.1.p1  ORF type:complete len:305 (+),score=78.15 GEMP01018009.1:88-1002(+)